MGGWLTKALCTVVVETERTVRRLRRTLESIKRCSLQVFHQQEEPGSQAEGGLE